MITKPGDIIFCKKDFYSRDVENFVCKRGDEVIVDEYTDTGVLLINTYYDKQHNCYRETYTWMYHKRTSMTRDECDYIWSYFITKKGRSNRVKRIAKRFL